MKLNDSQVETIVHALRLAEADCGRLALAHDTPKCTPFANSAKQYGEMADLIEGAAEVNLT